MTMSGNIEVRTGARGRADARGPSPASAVRSLFADFRLAAFWAGLTAFIWYVFGALPLHLEVAEQLQLMPVQASAWIFFIWFSSASLDVQKITLLYSSYSRDHRPTMVPMKDLPEPAGTRAHCTFSVLSANIVAMYS